MTVTKIDQSLHGYSDGHRLLAISRHLRSSSLRLLRTLTDLSGHRLASHFEKYYLGFSLPEDRVYVFCCTWYAAEAERPGCVWSHCFLLDERIVTDYFSLNDLLPYFSHPKDSGNWVNYEAPIEHVAELIPSTQSSLLTEFGSKAVSALYNNPLPIIIPAKDSATHEQLHIDACDHYRRITGQWLEFCTGSMQLRRTSRGDFDLQTVPTSSLREVLRNSVQVEVITDSTDLRHVSSTLLAPETLTGVEPSFTAFIREYASFPGDGRASLTSYATIYDFLNDQHRLDSLAQSINVLQDRFSDQRKAEKLKTAIASAPGERQFFKQIPDSMLLTVLIQENHSNSFDPSSLGIPQRLIDLWKYDRDETVELLLVAASHKNDIATLLIEVFAETIRPEDIATLVRVGGELFPALAAANPSLLSYAAVWKAPEYTLDAMIHAVNSSGRLPKERLNSVVWSQIDSDTPGIGFRMVDSFGVRIADAVYTWATANRWKSVPSDWQDALESLGSQYTSWLARKLESDTDDAGAIARMLSPHSESVRNVPSSAWLMMARRDSPANAALSLFAMLLGTERKDIISEQLYSSSFHQVYTATMSGTNDERVWRAFESRVEKTWKWDKCRTLRVDLVARFTANAWAPENLVHAIRDPDLYFEILSMWGWSAKEKLFLSRTIEFILTHQLQFSEFRDIALNCAHWFR